MTKRFIYSLLTLIAIDLAVVCAEEGKTKAAEGTLTLDKKSYQLRHALVYESTVGDEDAVVAVLSGQPVPSETLKEARAAEKDGSDGDFKKPFLKLVFKKTGELRYWSAGGGGTTMGHQGAAQAKAELKLSDGRANGKASQASEADAMIPSAFD